MYVNDMLKKRKLARERARKIEAAKKTATWVGIGTAVGAGLGILFAPKAGKETREIISNGASKAVDNLKSSSAEARVKINQILAKAKKNDCCCSEEIVESQEG